MRKPWNSLRPDKGMLKPPHFLEETMSASIKIVVGAGAGVTYLFGADFGEMLVWIIVLMVMDHVTAILAVLIDPRRTLERRKFLVGLGKKVLLLATFIPAGAIDRGLAFTELLDVSKHPTVAFVIISLVVHESGSVVRNIGQGVGRVRFLRELSKRISDLTPDEKADLYGRRRETDRPTDEEDA